MSKAAEYLSTIQGDMYAVGQRLKGIREHNGISLNDIAQRDNAEHVERGQWKQIPSTYLVQYCHEIGAALGPYNITPE